MSGQGKELPVLVDTRGFDTLIKNLLKIPDFNIPIQTEAASLQIASLSTWEFSFQVQCGVTKLRKQSERELLALPLTNAYIIYSFLLL